MKSYVKMMLVLALALLVIGCATGGPRPDADKMFSPIKVTTP